MKSDIVHIVFYSYLFIYLFIYLIAHIAFYSSD